MRTLLRLTCVATLALLGACCCGPVDSGGTVRELGFVEFHGMPVEVAVPQTARAGEPFTVRVVTRGGGCTSQGDTEATVSGAAADVEPYDLRATGPNVVCPEILKSFTHEASVRFDAPGTATVRIRGRREPGADTVVVTRTVDVQPAG